jgi:hypothetical protein
MCYSIVIQYHLRSPAAVRAAPCSDLDSVITHCSLALASICHLQYQDCPVERRVEAGAEDTSTPSSLYKVFGPWEGCYFFVVVLFCFVFVVLGFEFRAYTLNHSTSPFLLCV